MEFSDSDLRFKEVREPVSITDGDRRRVFIPCDDQAYAIARTGGEAVKLSDLANRGEFSINLVALDKKNAAIDDTLSALEPGEEEEWLPYPEGTHTVVAICPKFDSQSNGILELSNSTEVR